MRSEAVRERDDVGDGAAVHVRDRAAERQLGGVGDARFIRPATSTPLASRVRYYAMPSSGLDIVGPPVNELAHGSGERGSGRQLDES